MTEDNYIQLDDFNLYTRQIKATNNSSLPVLIFLHDSWGCIEMWDDFPEKIANRSGLNALMYDRRGYGKSSAFAVKQRTEYYLHEEADELIRVMDYFKIPKALLYGHSDGATISLIAAAKYPDRFCGLILEGAHSFIEDSGKAAVLESRERAKTNTLLKSLKRYHGDKTEELFRLWHETWLSDFFAHWTIVPLLKNIKCPVLSFQGVNDPFGTVEQLNVLKKEIKAPVTITEIQNSAHTPRSENEPDSMKCIREFLISQKENNYK